MPYVHDAAQKVFQVKNFKIAHFSNNNPSSYKRRSSLLESLIDIGNYIREVLSYLQDSFKDAELNEHWAVVVVVVRDGKKAYNVGKTLLSHQHALLHAKVPF